MKPAPPVIRICMKMSSFPWPLRRVVPHLLVHDASGIDVSSKQGSTRALTGITADARMTMCADAQIRI